MTYSKFDLAGLLAPVSLDTFFKEYWEKKPLLVQREQPDYFKGLFSLEDADRLISSAGLRHPTIRLVKNGVEIPFSRYTTNLPWGGNSFTGLIDPGQVYSEYLEGSTIILQALHRNWPPLTMLCRSLEAFFYHSLQTNLYLTPRASQGFAPHYDSHDVLVLQVHGSKHWKIYQAPTLLPGQSRSYSTTPVDTGLLHEIEFKAGDVMYLPRGYIHEALTAECESLHITLGITTYTWTDVFTQILAHCKEDERFRRSLPVGWGGQPAPDEATLAVFEELRQVFDSHARLEEALEKIGQRFISTRPPGREGYLTGISRLDSLDAHTVLRLQPGLLFKQTAGPETVRVVFQGKRLTFPHYVEPALNFMAGREQFEVGAISEELDEPGKLVLCRRLLKEGFLAFVRD